MVSKKIVLRVVSLSCVANIVYAGNCASMQPGDTGEKTLLTIPATYTDNSSVTYPINGPIINAPQISAYKRTGISVTYARTITASGFGFCGTITTYQAFTYNSPNQLTIYPSWGVASAQPGYHYTMQGHNVNACTMGPDDCKRYKVGKQEVTATHSYSGEWQALNLFMHLYTVMYDTHAQTQQSVTHTQDSYWKWEFCPPEDMP